MEGAALFCTRCHSDSFTLTSIACLQLKPFVDLAGSLLQALQPSPNNRSLGSATGLFQEMILTMRKAGITKAIINSIRLIDMEHPGVWLATCLLNLFNRESVKRYHSSMHIERLDFGILGILQSLYDLPQNHTNC